ncbi:hypothetical protein RDV64_21150 [Acuticoccus sp. MNP-M23]|uniref:hypothetical protein n=1 Tax=Acuticoccus sp. MNP-M23 TaxID=3072793 RepID=UPI00281539FF|nr:hypothetical protein [Acuticoccus sp. MNP-M23]WMS42541.1 hypothetical protein RDV64_21150 [Acuticoccus sp. MNP-M23]
MSRTGDRGSLWRQLDDGALQTILRGHPTEGVYNDGMRFFEELRADMTTQYQDDKWKTAGVYRIENGEICFAYDQPMDTGCFEVWQRSENCFDLYFTGPRTTPNASYMNRLTGTGWDARFWLADRPATCPEAGLA